MYQPSFEDGILKSLVCVCVCVYTLLNSVGKFCLKIIMLIIFSMELIGLTRAEYMNWSSVLRLMDDLKQFLSLSSAEMEQGNNLSSEIVNKARTIKDIEDYLRACPRSVVEWCSQKKGKQYQLNGEEDMSSLTLCGDHDEVLDT